MRDKVRPCVIGGGLAEAERPCCKCIIWNLEGWGVKYHQSPSLSCEVEPSAIKFIKPHVTDVLTMYSIVFCLLLLTAWLGNEAKGKPKLTNK